MFLMREVKDANREVGQHFFDRSSMAFFNSRIESTNVIGGKYFVTSEQFVGSDGTRDPRKYTVRSVETRGVERGAVKTADGTEFQQFHTKREATDYAYSLPGEDY